MAPAFDNHSRHTRVLNTLGYFNNILLIPMFTLMVLETSYRGAGSLVGLRARESESRSISVGPRAA
jgi:hypothetical protein